MTIASKPDARASIASALASQVDDALAGVGFARVKRSLSYAREFEDAHQEIEFAFEYRPRYHPGADIHLLPVTRSSIYEVNRVAKAMVANAALLGGEPILTVAQPIDTIIPRADHRRWYASSEAEVSRCCADIAHQLLARVIPFLSDYSTAAGMVRGYETEDPRVLRQQHWYLLVAASYLALNRPDDARAVLEARLGAKGLRVRYARAFEYVQASVLGEGPR